MDPFPSTKILFHLLMRTGRDLQPDSRKGEGEGPVSGSQARASGGRGLPAGRPPPRALRLGFSVWPGFVWFQRETAEHRPPADCARRGPTPAPFPFPVHPEQGAGEGAALQRPRESPSVGAGLGDAKLLRRPHGLSCHTQPEVRRLPGAQGTLATCPSQEHGGRPRLRMLVATHAAWV